MSEFKIWNEACQRWDIIGGGGCIEVTYAELVAKIGASELVCGQYYTITDFATVHWMVDSSNNYILDGEGEKIIHTGANEPLVVLATSENTLAVDAYSLTYPDDVIKYNWDWTDFTLPQFNDEKTAPMGFKGVITRREDTLKAIKTNYDFREITYRLWDITQTAWDSGTTYNASEFVQNGPVIYYATNTSTDVEPGVDEGWESYWTLLLDLSSFDNAYLAYLPNGLYIPFLGNSIPIVDTDVFIDRTMFLDDSCNNIVFDECNYIPFVTYGSYCYNMTYGSGCYNMTYGSECGLMTYGSSCRSMTYGSDCFNMTYGIGCGHMTYGIGCFNMTYGSNCNTMTYGSRCRNMTYGSSCFNMTYESYCESMTYGSYCGNMTYGSGCGGMTYGSNCGNMTYGSGCGAMTYGSNCNSMTYGSGCGNMTYGNVCYTLTFPDCCRNNDFKDGVNTVDYTLATQITDGSNVTHQLSNGTVYQSYIDSSGPPAFIITTNTIGNTGLCNPTTTTTIP